MYFLYIKALHIIFVTTWFAGLFYVVRLFIYHAEASEKEEPEKSILVSQYKLMEHRLWYIITWPSAVITLILGLALVHSFGTSIPNWLWVKFALVFGLFVYHFWCHWTINQLKKDKIPYTSQQFRIWNEVATLFLFSIVFLVILKSALDVLWGILGLVGLMILLMIGIRLYKRLQK